MSDPNAEAIYAAFKFLGWLFPPPPLDKELIPSPEALKKKGNRWSRINGALCLALLVVCARFVLLH